MGASTLTSDDTIEIKINGKVIAHILDGGNGMEGDIFEPDNVRMGASQLISLARFILDKAADRALDLEIGD